MKSSEPTDTSVNIALERDEHATYGNRQLVMPASTVLRVDQ